MNYVFKQSPVLQLGAHSKPAIFKPTAIANAPGTADLFRKSSAKISGNMSSRATDGPLLSHATLRNLGPPAQLRWRAMLQRRLLEPPSSAS